MTVGCWRWTLRRPFSFDKSWMSEVKFDAERRQIAVLQELYDLTCNIRYRV